MPKPSLKTTRRLVQIIIALGFVGVLWLNTQGLYWLQGNFLAFDLAGLPLADPLAALQVAGHNWPWPWRLWLGGGLSLLLALALGTVFCSWGCPFGLLSELSQGLRRRLRPGTEAKPSTRRGFWAKAWLAGIGLLLVIALSLPPLLNQLSLPGWYSRIFQMYFLQGYWSWALAALLLILLVEMVAGRRLWCRYLCPQSLLLALVQLINPWRLQVSFARRRCHCHPGSSPCVAACPLNLNPKQLRGQRETECNNCGDCVVACQDLGRALSFGLGVGGGSAPGD